MVLSVQCRNTALWSKCDGLDLFIVCDQYDNQVCSRAPRGGVGDGKALALEGLANSLAAIAHQQWITTLCHPARHGGTHVARADKGHLPKGIFHFHTPSRL